MHRKVLTLTMMMAVLLAVVPFAQAITFGQPDGENHPNVGAMVVLEPDGNYYLYCSGTLIAPDVFLTAAHCTAAAAAYGAEPHDVFVTFDPVWDAILGVALGPRARDPRHGSWVDAALGGGGILFLAVAVAGIGWTVLAAGRWVISEVLRDLDIPWRPGLLTGHPGVAVGVLTLLTAIAVLWSARVSRDSQV